MEIIWTTGASLQLQEVFERLEDLSEGLGEKLVTELDRDLALLKSQPFVGSYFVKPVRKWHVAGKFGLIYATEPRGLVILAFVDMRSDLQPLKLRLRDWFDKL
jgi:hypothetical protein